MCPLSRSLQQMWLADNNEVVPLGLIDSDWGGTPIEAWSVVTHTIPQLVQRSNKAPESSSSTILNSYFFSQSSRVSVSSP